MAWFDVNCHRCNKAPALVGYIFCQACADHLVLEPGENMPGAALYTPHYLLSVIEGHCKIGGIVVHGPLVGSSALDAPDGWWPRATGRFDATRVLLVAIPQFDSPVRGYRLIVRDQIFLDRTRDYERDERGGLLFPVGSPQSRRQPALHADELRRIARVDDIADPIWRTFGPEVPIHHTPNLHWICEVPQLPAIPPVSGGRK